MAALVQRKLGQLLVLNRRSKIRWVTLVRRQPVYETTGLGEEVSMRARTGTREDPRVVRKTPKKFRCVIDRLKKTNDGRPRSSVRGAWRKRRIIKEKGDNLDDEICA
jgi:hypothetical protein